MTTFVIALSIWLHTLATVVFVGHYLFMSLVYLPVFERQAQGNALRELLEEVSGRLRPYFGLSLLIFIVTGTYLMMINEDYLGLGNFFGNAWSILIIVKHVIVLVFIALAVYSERAMMGKISDAQPQALRQFRLALGINTFLGILILLLTTAAQSVQKSVDLFVKSTPVEASLSPAWFGLTERINTYGYMIWMLVLASSS